MTEELLNHCIPYVLHNHCNFREYLGHGIVSSVKLPHFLEGRIWVRYGAPWVRMLDK